ncbi:MAG TPA: hypothetical protein PK522_00860 [Nitrosomonas sp.]|nr:hypothetical protein [Nitrosomonas sp.]
MKFNNAPVDPLKIQLIHDMLNSPEVNALWLEFVHLGNVPQVKHELRAIAFNRYAKARDAFLGLPALNASALEEKFINLK